MTEAERIAEYLLAIQWANISPDEVRAYLATPRCDADPDSCYEAVTGLAAMLSDVRRGEREACASEVRCELVEAERQGERMAAKFLGWALKHIMAREQAR